MTVQGTAGATRALVLTACFTALLPSSALAQHLGGGVKGGITLADVPKVGELIDLPGVSTALRKGFAAGGFLTVRFDNGFGIQPEVLYTQKGVKLTASVDTVSAEITLKTDFVDVPILARYTFGRGARGYVFAGPSFDFKASAKVKTNVIGVSEEEDIAEDVENFELALVFGGGVELGPVLVEARWSEGLTNLAKESSGEPSTNIKSRTFLFLGGFHF
jgi:hypothetical protein